jgi:putative oxidoreductase
VSRRPLGAGAVPEYSVAMLQGLSRFEGPIYAALRVIAGLMFSFHGMQKIFGWLSPQGQPEQFSQIWFGGIIELVGGILIAIGLLTRWAALLASGTMAVAYFQFHWKLEFANYQWLPGVNQGEMAVLYCFVFLLIAAHGPGIASVDGAAARRHR